MNRESYPNSLLIKNKYYIKNYDDEIDCTYAIYDFNIPEDYKELLIDSKYIREKPDWDIIFEKMRKYIDKIV